MNAPSRIALRRVEPKVESRRSRRLKVFLPTEIVIDEASVRAHVLDISSSGSLLHTGTEPLSGSEVIVRLKDDALTAKIVWVGAGRLGLEFSTELTDDQIDRILDDRV
jgi:hypothetical protein